MATKSPGGIIVDQFSKLAVKFFIVAVTAVVSVAPASGGVFFFENNSGITINSSGPALPYPSTINVSGVSGRVTNVVVTLRMTHTNPDDVEILLVNPTGLRKVLLMSKAGGTANIQSVTLTFNECAPRLLPNDSQIVSGVYKTTTYATNSLPAPAPAEPYGPGLGEFVGTQPAGVNGTWSLYVNDTSVTPVDGGTSGFWNITFFTNDGSAIPGPGVPVPCAKPDFDGDGRADIAVYQDATGNWFVEGSAVGFFSPALNFGGSGFIPVAGDYDGDGITDPAVYQASSGNWFVFGSSSGFFTPALNFGGPGFTPVPRDYDGDGITDPAVYQASSGNWFVFGSSSGFFSVLNFGGSGFSPVSAAE
jgi:subtilisin-like proprotein convertase family protein